MRVKPEYYRKQAKLSRELAKRAVREEIRRHLLSVADEYEKLAFEAEQNP
jgi:hypothetical protein